MLRSLLEKRTDLSSFTEARKGSKGIVRIFLDWPLATFATFCNGPNPECVFLQKATKALGWFTASSVPFVAFCRKEVGIPVTFCGGGSHQN